MSQYADKKRLQRAWATAAWRTAVLELDDWTCTVKIKCQGAQRNLDACHMISRAMAPSRAFDLNPAQGFTACRACHEYLHAHPAEHQKFVQNFTRP